MQVILPEQISVVRTYWLLVHEDLRQIARGDAVDEFLTQILGQNPELMMGD